MLKENSMIVPSRKFWSAKNDDCQIFLGNCLKVLEGFEDNTFQCCITSPPYWGLRDYGIEGQIGAEMDVNEYIQNLVSIFREVRRVLKDDGTFWLNIGDSYTSGGRTWRQEDKKNKARGMSYRAPTPEGLKPKDLVGVPWRLAFALQQDGWYLRSDIIWNKPNNQPESVKDRPTRCHEYVFLLTKNEKYYYNYEAVKEDSMNGGCKKNRRTIWNINTEPYPEAHFAVFPHNLVRVCLDAGSKDKSIILDPFFGSGTVGSVCIERNLKFVGIELKEEYIQLALKRLYRKAPLLIT